MAFFNKICTINSICIMNAIQYIVITRHFEKSETTAFPCEISFIILAYYSRFSKPKIFCRFLFLPISIHHNTTEKYDCREI